MSKIVTTSDENAFAEVEVYQGERARCIDTCCFENNCGDDSSISVDKDSYLPGEEITVSFSNNSPKSYDWIWIVDGASVDEFGTISETYSSEALWLYICGSEDCSETPSSGDLKFDSSGLQAGRYVAYYLWKDDHTVAVASSPFTVIEDGNTLPPTEEPTPNQYPLRIDTNASSYSSDEVIHVSFLNPNPTHYDWVGIYSADETVSKYGEISDNYLDWEYACGLDDCDEVAVFDGDINFYSRNLDAGTYRAYLLFGDDENVLDRSEEFTVGLPPIDVPSGVPSDAPTDTPTNSPTDTPAACPDDILLVKQTGVTAYPKDAVRIIRQDGTTVTVELKQTYTDTNDLDSSSSIDQLYYQYQYDPFDSVCLEEENFQSEDPLEITIECTVHTQIGLLELWVADDITKNVLSVGDNAVVPKCCHPMDLTDETPVAHYVLKIRCGSALECPEQVIE